jgi:hypothetical protein
MCGFPIEGNMYFLMGAVKPVQEIQIPPPPTTKIRGCNQMPAVTCCCWITIKDENFYAPLSYLKATIALSYHSNWKFNFCSPAAPSLRTGIKEFPSWETIASLSVGDGKASCYWSLKQV